ncbi:MAG: response regulator [Thermodesulfobacteriota bacterium]
MADIMIVEDEAVAAMATQVMVSRLGHSVCATAASGEDALEAVSKARPALVLMDIMLAGELDGIETARRIRERYGIPVCFISAYSDPETRRRAQDAQPAAFLPKPLDPAKLKELLSTLSH